MSENGSPFLVEFQPTGRRVLVPPSVSLLAAAQSAGIELQSVCGGAGTCNSCRLRLLEGHLSSAADAEITELGSHAFASGSRLACRAFPRSNVRVEVFPESLTAAQRLQFDGQEAQVPPDPALLARLAPLVPPGCRPLGLAFDIGTTKLAAYLVDLQSGRTLARHGAMNPQIVFGEDVISRISFACRSEDNRKLLQDRLAHALNRMAAELCGEAGTSADCIAEAVVVGNTAMHHLFAGLPVAQVGQAPYLPATTAPLHISARDLHLHFASGAAVYLPPVIAGHVGADHVAVLLASGLPEKRGAALAVDIGTNTEISLSIHSRLLSCSCASGPAFEGAHIQCGMRAAPGAIERVRIISNQICLYTIGGVAPVGICGSGILDAVAEMLDAGAVNERGHLNKSAAHIRTRNGRSEVVLAVAAAGRHADIVLTPQDVNEIQLAKAAIRAGIEVLLEQAEISAETLDEVYLAGAFGTYLDLRSAARVGLLPGLPTERYRQIGNAAGVGARQMLVSLERRRSAEKFATRIEHVELSNHPSFHRKFVQALLFPPVS